MGETERAPALLGKAAKKHIVAFLTIILVFSTTACSSQTKEFQTTIDSFVEHYNVAIDTDDMLTQDIILNTDKIYSLRIAQLRQ